MNSLFLTKLNERTEVFMISGVTMRINIDEYLMNALKEDITQEDVSTNAVMPEPKQGEVNLICKQDGVICGLEVFERVFKLLDETVVLRHKLKDGDKVTKRTANGSCQRRYPCPFIWRESCIKLLAENEWNRNNDKRVIQRA